MPQALKRDWCLFLVTSLVFLPTAASRAEWPTYQHDSARSGSTSEQAPTNPVLNWTYRSPLPPKSAWDEPALWDGWSKVYDLQNRQVFDKAFHVAVSGGRVYFGSSVDDQIHCVDAKTGDVVWTFFTEGPVRLAPTVDEGRVYAGSDDGFVYCLNADSGKLIWKISPGPGDRRVAGNGRVVSPWAIRTSVVINGDMAFCGAGVIPSEGVYVVAFDKHSGQEAWRSEMTDLPAQGYMLASETRVYVVTSRDTPIVLDAKTGKRLHKVKGGTGGTYALLTGDTLIYGPSKTGDVNMIGAQQDVLASFQGNHMIVAQPFSYLQSKGELSSLDRAEYVRVYGERIKVERERAKLSGQIKKAKAEKKTAELKTLEMALEVTNQKHKSLGDELKACLKWRTECRVPHSLILADGTLIGGGDGEVIAVDAQTGKRLWKREVPGKAYGLAVSQGRLYVSTDQGSIHCFADDGPNRPIAGFKDRPVRHQSFMGTLAGPQTIPHEIHGPFVEFVAQDKIKIEWDTVKPMTSTVRFGIDMTSARSLQDDELAMQHEIIVDNIQPEVVYRFQVGGKDADGKTVETEAYRFDSYQNYLPRRVNTSLHVSDEWLRIADQLINAAGVQRGYALVAGVTDGSLVKALAARSDLQIIVLERERQKVDRLRRELSEVGWYGTRVTVHQQYADNVKYGPYLANLLVSEKTFDGSESEELQDLYYCLRPAGGTLVRSKSKLNSDVGNAIWSEWSCERGTFALHRRARLAGTGEWSHQYATADNAACSYDDQITGELMIQWWGRPGARPMPDRGSRNPPPVSANGRLYVQGNRTLFGLDAYNGTILWAKQIPTMRRANMPRDGSNMVAADDHVCVAIHGKCVAFDGQTGERLRDFSVPEEFAIQQYDWGYVSRQENRLLGSAVRKGAQYLGDKGEWYEGFGDKDIAKVTSDAFFSQDVYSGETQWMYSHGLIINSTITIADGRVYFIESRNNAALEAEGRRLTKEVQLEQYLVALDVATGDVLWEKPYDFSKCQYVTYLTHAKGVLLITGTDEKSQFHTYAFDASNGDDLWQHVAPEKKGHHTGQLAHPTIVGDLVYFNKHTYELRTGKVLGVHNFNWHGCGVMSASNHSVFSRYEYHGMLDLETNQRTEFLGVRSGCWLSLIPSGGLLLAPETSAGCSCGHALQTSLAYVPKRLANAEALVERHDSINKSQ